ncbi:hypothetical protein SCALM49S_03914 [Streptomyces californicus]
MATSRRTLAPPRAPHCEERLAGYVLAPFPGSIAAMPRDPDGTFRTLRLRETYGGERPP